MKRFVLVASALLAGPALATEGGPDTFEILGFEPEDARVYLVRSHGGEAGLVPRLHYFVLRDAPPEQAPDRPIGVRSWYEGDPTWEEIADRLARLRQRLRPVERAPLAGAELIVRHGPVATCPGFRSPLPADEVAPVLEAAVGADRTGLDDSGAVNLCRTVGVTVRWDGAEARTELSTWGDVELASAWALPDGGRLVVLRHTGITVESGYAAEVPLLLARPAPP